MIAELHEHLKTCQNLPSLPTVAVRLVELGQDLRAGLNDVARVISLDPAIASKILRIANSPLYGGRRKSENLLQALHLLGINAALTLALTFSLVRVLPRGGRNGLDYRLYWRRSLIGAVAARATAERIGWSGREEAFLAGLLQDIGMVALYQAWPEPYGPLLDAQAAHPDLIVLEKERIGADHAEIGAWLLQHWRLPERLRFAVGGSHDPELSGAATADQPLVECVALSGRIADTWLAEDRATILSETQAQAQVRLGLDDAQLLAILEAVGEELPPVAAVFEFESPTPAQIKGLLYAAQEVLIVRNLQVLHDAQEAKRKADVLETRTRVLEEQTRRDALTGLFNRVHLDQVLEEEFQLAAEQQGSLSLAFLDLDHFKLVNDTYGHQAGDAVLVAFSRLVDTQVRRCDSVARYGGEEFIVVLPGVDASPAEAVCQRIVKHIAANLRAVDPAGGISLPVTCSIGLATFSRESPFEDPNGLIRAADRALYVAKQAGRNRVATYSPP